MNTVNAAMLARVTLVLLLSLLGPACSGGDAPPAPPEGPTSFVSGDDLFGDPVSLDTGEWTGGYQGEEPGGASDDDEPTMGDIYRVLPGGALLGLSVYQGLQVIDLQDVSRPKIIGRLPISGIPVEMHVAGDRALVLMNSWYDHRADTDELGVTGRGGAAVLSVDLSDRTAPKVLATAEVPGTIVTSRLAAGASRSALYVAARDSDWVENGAGQDVHRPKTKLVSFDVTDGAVAPRSSIDLGGYVRHVHAEPGVLLVARGPEHRSQHDDTVSIVDVSDPEGAIALRDTVTVTGSVPSQRHVDLGNGTLRVFSHASADGANYLQTWSASNPDDVIPADKEAFGLGQSLLAAVFLDDRAFAVTYEQQDPFHAFAIDPTGNVLATSELLVSGWNDFFRPVLSASRLVGIGVNDEDGRKLAVSLYDITSLTNPDPLVARAEVSGGDGKWDWSEASWDPRAFTVLDDAVEVQAPTGEIERGLVLLPFTTRDRAAVSGSTTSAVQIFTFSATTVTRRGAMEHETIVRRAFLPGGGVIANLSDVELSLHDHGDLDHPQQVGHVDIAPDYRQILDYGAHRVRLKRLGSLSRRGPAAKDEAQIVPRAGAIDSAEPVARVEVPQGAQLFKVGDLLVSVPLWQDDGETTLDVFDLSDPTAPSHVGRMSTFDLSWIRWMERNHREDPTVLAAGPALAFLRPTERWRPTAVEEQCHTRVDADPGCMTDQEGCTYWAGDRTCSRMGPEGTVCEGSFARCTAHEGGDTICAPVDATEIEGVTSSYCATDYPFERRWIQFEIDVVDLSDPASPRIARTISLPEEDEGVRLVAHGAGLFVSFKRQVASSGDLRPRARYFIRRIDLGVPARPVLGPEINVPGELLAVHGETIFTLDRVWGDRHLEKAVARLELHGGLAYLQSYHRFPGRTVESVAIDDSGLALVGHHLVWGERWTVENPNRRLSVLGPSLEVLSENRMTLATLHGAAGRRAILDAGGGLLLVGLEDPARPKAQAFFPLRLVRPDFLVDGGDLLLTAGPYGVHQHTLGATNLR